MNEINSADLMDFRKENESIVSLSDTKYSDFRLGLRKIIQKYNPVNTMSKRHFTKIFNSINGLDKIGKFYCFLIIANFFSIFCCFLFETNLILIISGIFLYFSTNLDKKSMEKISKLKKKMLIFKQLVLIIIGFSLIIPSLLSNNFFRVLRRLTLHTTILYNSAFELYAIEPKLFNLILYDD
ncbi:hypothetical protein M0813_12957 [Anaeramoeba flamelloides]|uniref:PRA1 family protein n=1 Tax=Anaeramoeba flamelloides TaxID=1746091 RepID=A0ABQ8ZA33_9EUKA|nr:hypothetical protein M0813_12957 [Anaeramoeba flamelloides]